MKMVNLVVLAAVDADRAVMAVLTVQLLLLVKVKLPELEVHILEAEAVE